MIDKDFELYLLNKYMKASDILFRDGIFHSKGEMRRSIIQSVIKINGELVTDVDQEFIVGIDTFVQRNKKQYLNGREFNFPNSNPSKLVVYDIPKDFIDTFEKFNR